MYVRKAKKTDLPGIQALQNKYAKMLVGPEHINHKDVAVVAYTDAGELVGFMWAGLMASNTVAYLDKVCIDPAHTGKGLHHVLGREMLVQLARKGVRHAFGMIKHDKYHDAAAVGALKMAMGSDGASYTYVYGDTLNTIAELKLMNKEIA